MSDSGAGPKGFTGRNMSDSGDEPKGFTGRNMSDSGAGPKDFTRSKLSYNEVRLKDFINRNISYSGAKPKNIIGRNMRDSGARPKYFTDRNIRYTGARTKDFTGSTMSDSGASPKYYTGTNMSDSGARPKYFTDSNINYSGAVQKDFRNMSYSGARPKYFTDKNLSYSGAGPKDFTGRNISYKMESQNKEIPCLTENDFNEFYRHLSDRLYDVLDHVGASEAFRELHQNCSILKEIIQTIYYQIIPRSEYKACYIFGSSSEGTKIPSFNSDVDVLVCRNDDAIANIGEAGDGCSLLMVRDIHTQPGYVKLQLVYNGQPQTVNTLYIDRDMMVYDSTGRTCAKHLSGSNKCKNNNTRNGPADTDPYENTDHVVSFRCLTIPTFSREWIGRNRQYKWPSKRMVDKMVGMGCFVVGVGHPMSIEQNIEWRLSFSLQEREMMFSMNMTQHKCYVTLKLIKKDIIEPVVGKSISSYHLKTCMFHAIENTRLSFWKKSNLSQCVFLCICILFKWVYTGYCPNFFIIEENMFDRDIHRRQRLKLLHHISVLLSNGFGFLFLIKLDNIGVALKYGTRILHMEWALTYAWSQAKHDLIQCMMFFRMDVCCKANVHENALAFINIILNFVVQTKPVNSHTKQQSNEAISYLIPHIDLKLAQSYASLAFNTYTAEARCKFLQEFSYHLRKGRNCDMTSPILLEATVFLKLEQYERCVGILDQLELDLNQETLSTCGCFCGNGFLLMERVMLLNNLSLSDIIGRLSTCMTFLRSDMSITPEALRYEMIRSINTQPVSTHLHEDTWFDMAVVDAKVYLYFLQYLTNVKLNRRIHKHMAIHKLESVLEREITLRHRETGYNLLGWIHLQENWIPRAIKYFKRSWAIRPHHNAAKLHMLLLIRDINS